MPRILAARELALLDDLVDFERQARVEQFLIGVRRANSGEDAWRYLMRRALHPTVTLRAPPGAVGAAVA
jgi:hypothetical protein